MLRVGLIGLAIALGCVALLALLSQIGLLTFGPCGPDPLGMIFLLGCLVCGGVGLLLTVAGLLQKAFRKPCDDEKSLVSR